MDKTEKIAYSSQHGKNKNATGTKTKYYTATATQPMFIVIAHFVPHHLDQNTPEHLSRFSRKNLWRNCEQYAGWCRFRGPGQCQLKYGENAY